MRDRADEKTVKRVLVIMPSLLREAVMATATLEALRGLYPDAHITALVKRKLRPVLFGLDSVDRVLSIRRRSKASPIRLGRRLSRGQFDMAIILHGSFRAAALASLAGIPRRVGYERDGRGVLLTDRLVLRKHRRHAVEVSPMEMYLGIARYLGAELPDHRTHQRVSPRAAQRLDSLLADTSASAESDRLLLTSIDASSPLNTPHRQALTRAGNDHGLTAVSTQANPAMLHLPELARDLHLLKAAISRAGLLVTDDPAVQQLGIAFGVPVVMHSKNATTTEDGLYGQAYAAIQASRNMDAGVRS